MTCPQLRSFHVDDDCSQNLTDEAAKHLSRCSQLEHVRLGSEKLTDTAVEHLSKCQQLRILDLALCFNLTDAAVEDLSKCLQIQCVSLGHSSPNGPRAYFTNV